ncbi:hypothetical protein I551_9206 [Mycobacterium ulcerans str. Harvey]|uniref:PE family protein n=1 Tax=Mycobacterium ulcerans str. Harvey TaxID=1299332 RepID=A0ABN0R8M0_MYCUL|nr:hypothetical protein I551_9206 [Mycobacterium ulcerans str. Harvey]
MTNQSIHVAGEAADVSAEAIGDVRLVSAFGSCEMTPASVLCAAPAAVAAAVEVALDCSAEAAGLAVSGGG